MESGNSNCQSMSNSFSLYERYLRSFNVVDKKEEIADRATAAAPIEPSFSINCDYETPTLGNIDLSSSECNLLSKSCNLIQPDCMLNHTTYDITDKCSSSDVECIKIDSEGTSPAPSLLDNSSVTTDRDHSLLTEKSNHTDVHVSSEESRPESFKQPIFITSTMENSNNAVDSVPMFHDVRHTENVFKLPISELSFNGTIKHVKKLKPIVDPLTALSSNQLDLEDKSIDQVELNPAADAQSSMDQNITIDERSQEDKLERPCQSASESQYDDSNNKNECVNDESCKWNLDQSYSSFEASFDSGVRSPDMFSDDDVDDINVVTDPEPFWSFIKNVEVYDKRRVKKVEEMLQGLLPPPSVTIIKTDVSEMLKKYYTHLPLFNENVKLNVSEEANSTTPTKRVSFVEIPDNIQHSVFVTNDTTNRQKESHNNSDLNTSFNDNTIELKTCTQIEAIETIWPNVLKCRHHDIYYNITKYSEKFELLSLKYGERYVGAETDTSVNVHSGGFQSPSSATKRKALRLKMAQAKSPGRRLSHLARRRQAFCSAATINEKAHTSGSKMVLIDKKKLINSAERKSPRLRRTPGKKTPNRKTPGKKTPAKTPKTRSGGSSKKKAMRRLLMDSESMTRSQPTRETLKRALFISPENKKIPVMQSTSVPSHAMKTKRALFGSPVRAAETKSSDGTQSDQFLKRKLDSLDEPFESSRSKIAKSLSFGGGTIGSSQSISINRRASEVFTSKKSDLNDNHKQKLLWAVSEALRVHGWRMSSPGFREKASNLARLTRKLLTLPPHAARLAATNLSTSDTMLKLARQYVFAIIQGRSVEECFEEEQIRITNEANSKVSGYISANAYQQIKSRPTTSTFTSQIKENTCDKMSIKQEQPKSSTKNVLQDKLVNIDSNSNSSCSGFSTIDKAGIGFFKSNSMPSFEEAAKMRARRQISFDNIDFPKR